MLNTCLERPCSSGFAFHKYYPVQIDYSGAFRYKDFVKDYCIQNKRKNDGQNNDLMLVLFLVTAIVRTEMLLQELPMNQHHLLAVKTIK